MIFLSCGQADNSSTHYTVSKTKYINQVTTSGYLEAANSIDIVCPRLRSNVTIQYLIPEGTYVNKGDTVCILDAPEIQTMYDNAKSDLEVAEIDYKKTHENLNLQYLLLEAQVRTIEATTQISQLDSLQKEYVSESQKRIIELEMEKSRIEKEKVQNKLKFLKRINESELRKMKLKIKQSENNLNRAKDFLDKLIITTPVEGLVQYAHNWSTGKNVSEGDVIWDNSPILTIPDMSDMKAHIVTSESYYKRIAPKQKVRIDVDAFPDIQLSGTVERKAPVGRNTNRDSPVKSYDIFAGIDSLYGNLQPGLSLTCYIEIEELSDTITIPLTSIFENDSASFVYLKKDRQFVKQPVTIGNQSTTHAVVTEGLKENDVISLIKP